MRILCLDVGSRRIGVAISDPEEILATPLTVVDHEDETSVMVSLRDLIHEKEVERIVVGMPFSLEGGKGPQAVEVEDFIRRLAQHTDVPIETWDERFSTATAQQMMADAGVKRSRRKENIDALAAAVILQAYLDRV
jgi:putative Holliday junction resolvase